MTEKNILKEKYSMFKNFMHNELGITKEDIKAWTQEAVSIEAKKIIENKYSSIKIDDIIRKELVKFLGENRFYGQNTLTREAHEIIRQSIGDMLKNQLVIRVEEKKD